MTIVQTNERFGAESRRMTTSTARILIPCGAMEVKTRYSVYARWSLVMETSTPETLIRIDEAKASRAP